MRVLEKTQLKFLFLTTCFVVQMKSYLKKKVTMFGV